MNDDIEKFIFMNKKIKLFITIIITFVMFQCTSCRVACISPIINPAFIGYKSNELDSIYLKSYEINSNFAILIDSFPLSTYAEYTTIGDTTIIDVNAAIYQHNIISGFDWGIVLPKVNRVYYISNIVTSNSEGHKNCTNTIYSMKVNDMTVTPVFSNTGRYNASGYRVYLKR